jgi:RHS repeat-associated protein
MDGQGGLLAAFEDTAISGSTANSIVRRRPDGRVVKVHGQGGGCGSMETDCPETGLATESRLGAPGGISLSPSGELYVVDTNRLRLKVISPALPRFASRLGGTFETFAIASGDGALLYLFDAAGRHLLTTRTATGEDVYRFEYTSAGHLHRVEHVALGRDPSSGGPRYTTIHRDAGTGRATSITGPFGQVTTLTVDERGWLRQASDPLAHAHTFTYAGTGGLLSVFTTPRPGATTHFVYDARGRLTRDTDPNGRDLRLALTTEALGRSVEVTVPAPSGDRYGRTHTTTPNAQGGEARTVVPQSYGGLPFATLSSTTVYGPAAASASLPLRAEALRAGEVWSIAPDGTVTRTTPRTEMGATTSAPSERFASQASFVGRVQILTPRPSWDPPTMGAPAYYQTDTTRRRHVIMPPGSVSGVTDPGQRVVDTVTIGGRTVTVEDRRLTESPLVRRVKTSAPGGRHAWLDYDAQGRVLAECTFGTVDGAGAETCSVALRTYQYYPTTHADAGLLERVTQGERVVRYGYTNGLVSSVTAGPDGDTRTVTTLHDAAGRAEWVEIPGATSGATHRTLFGYDPDDVLNSVTTPRMRAHAMGADLLGQPTVTTPPTVGGSSTSTTQSWRVDRALDLLTLPSANDPGGPTGPGGYRASYDTLGRSTGFAPEGPTAPAGASDVFYDAEGRVESVVNVLGGGADVTVSYGYAGAIPAREQQSFAAAGATWSGVVQHALDDELRPARTRIEAAPAPAFQQLTRHWDADGLHDRTTLDGNDVLTFSRAGDVAGRVRSMVAGWGSQYANTTFTYDDTTTVPLGARYGALLGESTSYQMGALRYAYDLTAPATVTPRRAWDAHGRITHLTENLYLGTAGVRTVEHAYIYDYGGRLESETRTTTDPGMAPVSVTDHYTYDANGNRLTGPGQTSGAGVTYDAQDRLTGSYAGLTHTWTPRGAVNTRSLGGQTITYRYDVFGALQSVAQTSRPEVTYVNDALGRRLAKLVGGVMKRRYVYDGDRLVAEVLHDAGQTLRTYVYGSRANVPDVMVVGNVPHRILTDHRGSVRSVVRLYDGVVVQRMEYDAWGAVLERGGDGSFAPIPFGFAGGLYDDDTGFMSATGRVLVAGRETGLVRFGARDYDAVTGRWMAKEPLGFGGGEVGLYTYVGNDPVNLIDVNGTYPCSFWRGFARGVVSGAAGAVPGIFIGAAVSLVIPAGAAAPLAAVAAVATVASLAGQWIDVMLSGASACQMGELLGRTAVSMALLGVQRSGWYRRGSSNDQRFFSHRSARDRLNDDWGDRGINNASFGQYGGLPPASRPSSMGWNPFKTLTLMSSGPTPMARHGLRWTAPTSTMLPADRVEQVIDYWLE